MLAVFISDCCRPMSMTIIEEIKGTILNDERDHMVNAFTVASLVTVKLQRCINLLEWYGT
jgi:hypothetical protein